MFRLDPYSDGSMATQMETRLDLSTDFVMDLWSVRRTVRSLVLSLVVTSVAAKGIRWESPLARSWVVGCQSVRMMAQQMGSLLSVSQLVSLSGVLMEEYFLLVEF